MGRRHALSAFILAASVLAPALGAQDTVAIAFGTPLRLRSRADAPWQYGRFSGVVGDTLLLGTHTEAGTQRYALSALQTIDLRGTDGSVRREHIGTGALLGIVGGALALQLLVRHCEATSHSGDGPPCAIGYAGLPIYMAGGAVAGALVGVAWPAKRWRAVTLRR